MGKRVLSQGFLDEADLGFLSEKFPVIKPSNWPPRSALNKGSDRAFA